MSVSFKFDVSDQEANRTSVGEQPKPGVYDAELYSITVRDDRGEGKASDFECMYMLLDKETGERDSKLVPLFDYVGYEAENTKWKLAQFLEALGVADEKNRTGEFNPADHCVKLNGNETTNTRGTIVKVRVKGDSYEGNYKGKLAAVVRHPDAEGSGGSSSPAADDPFA